MGQFNESNADQIDASADASINKEEVINEFLQSKDFIDLLNAKQGEAVNKFKKEKLPSILDEEVDNRMKAREHKEPWQIKLEEMERKTNGLNEKLLEKERAELRAENKAFAVQTLSERKLPTDLVDYLISDEKEKTQANLDKFASSIENYTQKLKQQILKGNNVEVPAEGTSSQSSGSVPGKDASQAEWEAYYKKNR